MMLFSKNASRYAFNVSSAPPNRSASVSLEIGVTDQTQSVRARQFCKEHGFPLADRCRGVFFRQIASDHTCHAIVVPQLQSVFAAHAQIAVFVILPLHLVIACLNEVDPFP